MVTENRKHIRDLTEQEEEKLSKGMIVTNIKEKNQKFKYSDNLESIVEKQKDKTVKITTYKKTKQYKTYERITLPNIYNKDIISLHLNYKKNLIRNKLNKPISNSDMRIYKEDSVKQYKCDTFIKTTPFTEDDVINKFGTPLNCEPDNSILEEIRSMKARGL